MWTDKTLYFIIINFIYKSSYTNVLFIYLQFEFNIYTFI